jgi:hypothetical protein
MFPPVVTLDLNMESLLLDLNGEQFRTDRAIQHKLWQCTI